MGVSSSDSVRVGKVYCDGTIAVIVARWESPIKYDRARSQVTCELLKFQLARARRPP
jgi:hypothetical protein